MARTKTLQVETSIHLRDEDWTVTGTYSPGSPAYFCRSFGNYLPGDPPEIEDVEILADGHDGVIEYDHLTRAEQLRVDDALADAAADEDQSRQEDEGDRRYDEMRDRRLGL